MWTNPFVWLTRLLLRLTCLLHVLFRRACLSATSLIIRARRRHLTCDPWLPSHTRPRWQPPHATTLAAPTRDHADSTHAICRDYYIAYLITGAIFSRVYIRNSLRAYAGCLSINSRCQFPKWPNLRTKCISIDITVDIIYFNLSPNPLRTFCQNVSVSPANYVYHKSHYNRYGFIHCLC